MKLKLCTTEEGGGWGLVLGSWFLILWLTHNFRSTQSDSLSLLCSLSLESVGIIITQDDSGWARAFFAFGAAPVVLLLRRCAGALALSTFCTPPRRLHGPHAPLPTCYVAVAWRVVQGRVSARAKTRPTTHPLVLFLALTHHNRPEREILLSFVLPARRGSLSPPASRRSASSPRRSCR